MKKKSNIFLLLAMILVFFIASNTYAYKGHIVVGSTLSTVSLSDPRLNYGIVGRPVIFAPNQEPIGQTTSIAPESHFTYGFHAGYIFSESRNLLLFNYQHFENVDSNTILVGPNQVIYTTIMPADFSIGTDTTASADIEFRQDFYDLFVGHNFENPILSCQIFVGLDWTHLTHDFFVHYNITSDTRRIDQKNSFRGFGPAVGLQISRELFAGINLVGTTITRLPVGNLKLLYDAFGDNANDTIIVSQYTSGHIVPVISGMIALSRSFKAFSEHESLIITLGYEATWIVGAYRINNYVSFTSPTTQSTLQGFGNQGPFFRVSIVI